VSGIARLSGGAVSHRWETQPVVSTLNAVDGAITSNMAIVPTTSCSINAFAQNPTNLILDISSYFAP